MAGRITSLSVQVHNPDRANVYLDGEFAFGLAMIEAAKLSTGQFLTDADIEALKQFDEGERAHESALNLLSYRPRSEQEVRRRLGRKGFSEPAIEQAVQRLLRARLLDDEAFARYWISNREQFRPSAIFNAQHHDLFDRQRSEHDGQYEEDNVAFLFHVRSP